MIKFLSGVIVGILIFFFFLYFGGGKAVKKVGEELAETGKRMEILEERVKKERDDVGTGIQKKLFKEEKESKKKSQ